MPGAPKTPVIKRPPGQLVHYSAQDSFKNKLKIFLEPSGPINLKMFFKIFTRSIKKDRHENIIFALISNFSSYRYFMTEKRPT
jgi:hypothetical protein